MGPSTATARFSLLTELYGDPETTAIFSERRTIASWLEVERALALAQQRDGLLSAEEAEQIAAAATLDNIDVAALWRETRNVGYPILPLVRMISAALPEGPDGRVHYGATTQDIMDTGLALQLRAALDRLDALVSELGDAIAVLVEAHRHTVMAARTHGQQAVPTTFGQTLATYLVELARHRERLAAARERACRVSLHGAGGTSAALGPRAAAVRRDVGAALGLAADDVPWHVARDGIAEFGQACAIVAATCARFAREVIDLSRTELDELAEQDGHHRGASSTMPQKANPIGSEAVLGMAVAAGALSGALLRAMEAGHERAAGEWQIEWHVVPELAMLSAGALRTAAEVAVGLRVKPERMRANLAADQGLVMAEAYMMRLAGTLGRERAHDLVYAAAQTARREQVPLEEALRREAGAWLEAAAGGELPIRPETYVGDPDAVCDEALRRWGAGVVSQTID